MHIARRREKAFADARLFRTPILRRIFSDESPKCHFPYPAVTAAQRCRPWPIRHCLSLIDAVTATEPLRGHVVWTSRYIIPRITSSYRCCGRLGALLEHVHDSQFGWNLYCSFLLNIAQMMQVSFLIAAVTAFQCGMDSFFDL